MPEQTCNINDPKSSYIYTTTTTPAQLQSKPPSEIQTHPIPINHHTLRACIDSAASADMIPHKSYFETLTYYDQTDESTPSVMLGDESTMVPVVGYGLAKYTIHNKTIRKRALYVPDLGNTALISVHQHMQNKGCYFHAQAQQTTLAFPTFIITPRVAKEIDITLTPSTSTVLDFDELDTPQVSINQQSTEHPKKLLNTNQHQYNFTYQDANNYPLQEETKTVFIKKLSPQAQLPARSTPGSIGFDTTSTTTVTIQPNETKAVPTGLATAFPSDMYLRIACRSSMAMKQVIVKGGGGRFGLPR
jgi:hypothetical protein